MGIIVSSFIGCGREYLKNTHGNKVKIYDAVEQLSKNDAETYFNTVMSVVDDNDIVFIDTDENDGIRRDYLEIHHEEGRR